MRKKYIVNEKIIEAVIQEGLQLGGYPAGAANDPTAPYNQEEPRMTRYVDLKPADIAFNLLVTDDQEFAILEEKATHKKYILYFDTADNDYRQYMLVPTSGSGDDEEYDNENAISDDKTIESYASLQADTGHIGVGTAAYEKGFMAEIDDELKDELIPMFDGFKRYKKGTDYSKFITVLNR